jgi:hypothetical protein
MTAGSIACASARSPSPEVVVGSQQYLVVRFHVRSGQEAAFEEFFTESLLPATERLAESPEAFRRDLEAFTLLRPVSATSDEPSTYFVLYRLQGGSVEGEAMRDIVRRGFPGVEGQQRVQRWMNTIDLESLVPQGQIFERVLVHPGSGS